MCSCVGLWDVFWKLANQWQKYISLPLTFSGGEQGDIMILPSLEYMYMHKFNPAAIYKRIKWLLFQEKEQCFTHKMELKKKKNVIYTHCPKQIHTHVIGSCVKPSLVCTKRSTPIYCKSKMLSQYCMDKWVIISLTLKCGSTCNGNTSIHRHNLAKYHMGGWRKD